MADDGRSSDAEASGSGNKSVRFNKVAEVGVHSSYALVCLEIRFCWMNFVTFEIFL